MLKDLFFFIWFDEMGFGWVIFAVALFLLFLALIICIVARTKAQTKKLTKASWACILFALFLMYQIVPVSFDMLATLLGYNRIDYKK